MIQGGKVMNKYIKEILVRCSNSRDNNRLDENLKQEEQELVETIKYYRIKLDDLELKSKKSRKIYRVAVAAAVIIYVMLLIIFDADVKSLIDIIGMISVPVLLLLATRGYTVYLTSDQLRYECRDKLFEILTKLKRTRALTYDEQVLYNSLMEKLSTP